LSRIEESIEIRCPHERVWETVADPLNDSSWCPKVKSVQPAGEQRWLATHKPVPLRPAIELVVEQLVLERPQRLRLREEDAASVFEVEYLLEPTGDGTRFTQVSEIEWKRLPRVLHGAAARGVRRDVRGQLRNLKRLLER
jgi:carbon monoxide dehydrogenase subunit G